MTDDHAIALLVLWYKFEATWNHVAGYPSECPSTRGYRPSRQYDSENGAAESDERAQTAERIGAIIAAQPEPYRTALCILARNRALGLAVWNSPRLPDDKELRAAIVREALAIFGNIA